MKQLTVNLTGRALDWALAVALGKQPFVAAHGTANHVCEWNADNDIDVIDHTDPALCLGLIKKYRMDIDQVERYPDVWIGAYFESTDGNESFQDSAGYVAETLEQAVARCIVMMNIGSEVEIPDELVSKPECSRPSSTDYSQVHHHD